MRTESMVQAIEFFRPGPIGVYCNCISLMSGETILWHRNLASGLHRTVPGRAKGEGRESGILTVALGLEPCAQISHRRPQSVRPQSQA